jgi:hypothetical protein
MLVNKQKNNENVTDRTTMPSLQQIRRIQLKVRSAEFDSPEFIPRLREIGADFRLAIEHSSDETSRFLLMLSTKDARDLLVRFGNRLTFLDGTFSLVEANLVVHVFAVEHPDSGQLLPCVFALSDRRDEDTYLQMFECACYLVDVCVDWLIGLLLL